MNYRTEKRKAVVGERILITDDLLEYTWADNRVTRQRYRNGDVLTVTQLGYKGEDNYDSVVTAETPSGKVVNVNHDEYEVIIGEENVMELQKRGSLLVKAVPTPDYQETIGFTENEDGTYSLNFSKMPGLVFVSYDGVGSFDQLFVHGEFKAEAQRVKIDSAVGELTKYTIESTPVIKTEIATLHAGETVLPPSAFKVITAQEHRDEIVEMAKRDVAELKASASRTNGEPVYKAPNLRGCYAEYIVNKEKRTVVVLLRGCHSKKLFARGIAKCAPTDCFNAHIGKAIALRRALGLEVPAEYLNAPKPTEVRVGDVVCGNQVDGFYLKRKRFTLTSVNEEDGGFYYAESKTDWIEHDQIGRIIDDSRGDAE